MPIRSTDDQIKELKDLLGAIAGLQVSTEDTTSIHFGWMDQWYHVEGLPEWMVQIHNAKYIRYFASLSFH